MIWNESKWYEFYLERGARNCRKKGYANIYIFNINGFVVWNTISANFSSSISFWRIVRRDGYRMKIGVTFTKSFKLKWVVACILHYLVVVVVWILHTNASHPNSSHSRERKPTEWKNCCGFVILSHFLAGTSTFSRIFYWISMLCVCT